MLFKTKELKGFKLNCKDGILGKVKDFYFDDHYWTTRYLVADTGGWLSEKQVLISPYAITDVNEEEEYIMLDLSKKQIQDSPPLESDKPISKQYESSYYDYYRWPSYWDGNFMWGEYPYINRAPGNWDQRTRSIKPWNPNLRSVHAVNGNYIEATDGEIGHVADFLIDSETWAIRYLIADTHNFWPGGKQVLLSPQWIDRVSWPDKRIYVDVSKATIKGAPEYTSDFLITRNYETGLYSYYDQNGYWVNDVAESVKDAS